MTNQRQHCAGSPVTAVTLPVTLAEARMAEQVTVGPVGGQCRQLEDVGRGCGWSRRTLSEWSGHKSCPLVAGDAGRNVGPAQSDPS